MVRPSAILNAIKRIVFWHNHYANDLVMRARIEETVKKYATTEGLEDRGAEEAVVKQASFKMQHY
jgi:hypothetical protein